MAIRAALIECARNRDPNFEINFPVFMPSDVSNIDSNSENSENSEK